MEEPQVLDEPSREQQDIYTAVAQFEVVGPANNDTARIVLAAVVGLLVVGLVLLGIAVAAKRRNGPPTERMAGKQHDLGPVPAAEKIDGGADQAVGIGLEPAGGADVITVGGGPEAPGEEVAHQAGLG